MRRPLLFLLALIWSAGAAGAEQTALRPVLDLETGAVWAGRSDIGVPGSSGTRFSIASGGDFQTDTAPFVRVQAGAVHGRHTLFATFAPVRLSGDGRSGGTIFFRNLTFTADGQASAKLRYDTYGLTYRYALVSTRSLDLALGATALFRDSEIRLSQSGQSATQRDTRFLPLLSFRAVWRVGGPFALSIDGDAMAVKQWRAEDVALALEFATGDLTFRAGYRLVEGGTGDKRVHDFVTLNHALAGVSYRF